MLQLTHNVATLGDFAAIAVGFVIAAVLEAESPSLRTAREREPAEGLAEAAATEAAIGQLGDFKFHVIFAGVTTIFLSLFTAALVINLSDYSEAIRIGLGLSVFVHVTGTSKVIRQAIRAKELTLFSFSMILMGAIFSIAGLIGVAGLVPGEQGLILYMSILWTLGIAAIAFFSMLALRRQISG